MSVNQSYVCTTWQAVEVGFVSRFLVRVPFSVMFSQGPQAPGYSRAAEALYQQEEATNPGLLVETWVGLNYPDE